MAAIFLLLFVSSVGIKRMSSPQSACIFCHSHLVIRPKYMAFQLAKLLQSPFINGQPNNHFSQVVILLVSSQEPCIHVVKGENNDTS